MKTPFHFCRVSAVSLYQAPAVDRVVPYQIKAGHELVEWVLGGTVRVRQDGVERRLGAGTLFWEREGDWTLSDTDAGDPYRCLAVHFELLAPPPVRAPSLAVLGDVAGAHVLAEDLLRGFHGGDGAGALFGTLAYCRLAWAATASTAPAADPLPVALHLVLGEIQTRLSDKLGLAELSDIAGLSPTRLHQLFRRHLGTTPHQHILELRLRESRIRLARGYPSVKAVGAECGFASTEVFCRAFRKRFGLSPGAYRDQYRRPSRPV
jgi:AraC-like DNA-binding protein